jgi:glycerol-3-phosphate dehydrogenase (NAD(P)+)
MRLTVLGCGRWASFLGWYGNYIGHEVLIWGRPESKNLRKLIETRRNEYLELDPKIILSNSLEDALMFSDIIIISVSSQHLRNLCEKINNYQINGKTLILAMKGIEKSTGNRLSEVVASVIKQDINTAVWVGPGHAQDFTKGIPNCMLICSQKVEVSNRIINDFSSKLIRLYRSDDLIGSEIGAAAKNVIGIAAGMLDGLGFSSLKGALMARGAREVSRLISSLDGNELTAYGLSHIGDYEATLFSMHSNNRRFGEKVIKKEKFEKLAEGVATTESMIKLANDLNVELPITRAVYSVLIDKRDPKEVLGELFMRDIKTEFN